ncbi:MAG: hypothetical protein J0L92_07540 [Deltaproteobacteria bacterium]|nr:hypothetical protein [Deltaproteobacteria bacterium]
MIDLGLERFATDRAHREVAQAVLGAMVDGRLTTLVREILGSIDDVRSERPLEVLEAVRAPRTEPIVRLAAPEVATEVLKDVRALYRELTHVAFAWDELETLRIADLDELFLVLDGPAGSRRKIELPLLGARAVANFLDFDQRWPRRNDERLWAARRLRAIAERHRLILAAG